MECRCVPVWSLGSEGDGFFGECAAPQGQLFVAVDGGDTFTVGIVAGSRDVVGWGSAFYGELSAVENGLVKMEIPEQCTAVSCGSNHVLVVTDSRRVVVWGWNKFGQVAVAETEQVVRVPRIVEFPTRSQPVEIVEVAAGGMHSLAIDATGRVWAWGCNEFGQLGVGLEVEQLHTPKLVTLPSDVRVQLIAAGWAHSAMVSTTGELFTFGWGLYNQLGHGSTQNQRQPTMVDALQGLDSKIVQVACGNWHTAALTASGDLYTWGWGKDGQLGAEASTTTQVLPRVVNVSAGSAVSGEAQDVLSVACGHRFTVVQCRDGSVQHWGPHKSLVQPGWLRQSVLKLAAGSAHVILLQKELQDDTE